MQVSQQFIGLELVKQQLAGLGQKTIAQASAKALNDGAYKMRRDLQGLMAGRFDRVTPFIERSPYVMEATPDQLSVQIMPTYRRDIGNKGGKQGVDPQHVLQAQEFGGRRADKRFEIVLKRAGILPAGYQTVIPATPFPNSDDGRGNLRGPFLTQLLSYLQAFDEQGFRSNMKAGRIKGMHTRGGKSRNFVGPVRGWRYLVSYGSMRGGVRQTASGEYDRRMSNLPPGIWALMGTSGVDVRPVLMFVKQGNYKPLLNLQQLADDPEQFEYLSRRFRFRIREAFENQGQ